MFSHIVDVDPDGGSLHTGQGHAILEVLAVDFTLYHMIHQDLEQWLAEDFFSAEFILFLSWLKNWVIQMFCSCPTAIYCAIGWNDFEKKNATLSMLCQIVEQ